MRQDHAWPEGWGAREEGEMQRGGGGKRKSRRQKKLIGFASSKVGVGEAEVWQPASESIFPQIKNVSSWQCLGRCLSSSHMSICAEEPMNGKLPGEEKIAKGHLKKSSAELRLNYFSTIPVFWIIPNSRVWGVIIFRIRNTY